VGDSPLPQRIGQHWRVDPTAAAHLAPGQVLVPCPEPLSASIDFFTALGFGVRVISPADHPRRAVLGGHGMSIALEVDAECPSPVMRLRAGTEGARTAISPGGTVVEFVTSPDSPTIPPLVEQFTLSRAGASAPGEGRAGMQYRDLIDGRLGGRFIASHILIPDGGPVPDYVHFHDVRFQMIFCHRGWVSVLYEDQGDLITMREGDCVLQPSTIRHRVVEASAGMQVVEIGCPAEHDTYGDPALALPTGRSLPDRPFGAAGHRFVFHQAAGAEWTTWGVDDHFEQRDTGIGSATDGLAGVRVVRPAAGAAVVGRSSTGDAVRMVHHEGEFVFGFVLRGTVELTIGGDVHRLGEADAVTIPSKTPFRWSAPSADLEILEITLPALVPLG
jgi:quercetin dioxygenase-like cupin family protein